LRDPLTGLANRVLFQDRLAHAVRLQQRDHRPLAVVSLDLNDFKLVNDTLGHPTGDALLTRVAERIAGCVRSGDTVARLGGDEFAILIEDGPEHPREVAQRVVDAFDEPFVVDGQNLVMRPSVGLAEAPAVTADLCADLLLKEADVAMYSAKRARSNGLEIFTPDRHLVDRNKLDLPRKQSSAPGPYGLVPIRLLSELRSAIEHGDLDLAYQPKFDLRTGGIVGVEALVRWPHPHRGLLGPEHFLPLVRQNRLMQPLTELVIARALDDAVQWHARGFGMPVAVNLFAPSLGDRDLPSQITRALGARSLTADALAVEISEDLILGDMGRARSVLQQLRECGIRIAIDDFGSAYSALAYLRELPIDEVKLDRMFIAPILDDARTAAIVRAVIDLSHTLGVTTVAEGVENEETAARLKELGCDVAQGYHYSPPVSFPALLRLLSSSNWEVARPVHPAGQAPLGVVSR
jgi:diguanylate cyclase (GGDEF)-like protein